MPFVQHNVPLCGAKHPDFKLSNFRVLETRVFHGVARGPSWFRHARFLLVSPSDTVSEIFAKPHLMFTFKLYQCRMFAARLTGGIHKTPAVARYFRTVR